MKRLFIGQVLSEKTLPEINAEAAILQNIAESIVGEELEIITDLSNDSLAELADSISDLSTADYAIFSGGWMNFNKTLIEYFICEKYKIPIIEYRVHINND